MILTQQQQFLHNARLRRSGLTTAIAQGEPWEAELARIQAAVTDIESQMTEQQLADYQALVNPVLTARQQADLARKQAAQMAENRDRPSI